MYDICKACHKKSTSVRCAADCEARYECLAEKYEDLCIDIVSQLGFKIVSGPNKGAITAGDFPVFKSAFEALGLPDPCHPWRLIKDDITTSKKMNGD